MVRPVCFRTSTRPVLFRVSVWSVFFRVVQGQCPLELRADAIRGLHRAGVLTCPHCAQHSSVLLFCFSLAVRPLHEPPIMLNACSFWLWGGCVGDLCLPPQSFSCWCRHPRWHFVWGPGCCSPPRLAPPKQVPPPLLRHLQVLQWSNLPVLVPRHWPPPCRHSQGLQPHRQWQWGWLPLSPLLRIPRPWFSPFQGFWESLGHWWPRSKRGGSLI